MRKRYYGRRRSYNRDKYSIEHTGVTVPGYTAESTNGWTVYEATSSTAQSIQRAETIVPATSIQGMRKVKHLTISLTTFQEGSTPGILYALVYVPEGYDPQPFTIPNTSSVSASLYSANQYIMSSGIIDFNAGPQRISSHLSRNLNSGDRIVLLLALPQVGDTFIIQPIFAEVTYAITLQ